jgi:hypothetical protein
LREVMGLSFEGEGEGEEEARAGALWRHDCIEKSDGVVIDIEEDTPGS